MSLSTLQKLENEREALAKKIAEERKRIIGRIGGDLVKAFGHEAAVGLTEKIVEAVGADSADRVISRIDEALKPSNAGMGESSERREASEAVVR